MPSFMHACSCASGDAHYALELANTTFHAMRRNKDTGVDFNTYNLSLLHLVDGLISDDDD
jgi:hypothetical protein